MSIGAEVRIKVKVRARVSIKAGVRVRVNARVGTQLRSHLKIWITVRAGVGVKHSGLVVLHQPTDLRSVGGKALVPPSGDSGSRTAEEGNRSPQWAKEKLGRGSHLEMWIRIVSRPGLF